MAVQCLPVNNVRIHHAVNSKGVSALTKHHVGHQTLCGQILDFHRLVVATAINNNLKTSNNNKAKIPTTMMVQLNQPKMRMINDAVCVNVFQSNPNQHQNHGNITIFVTNQEVMIQTSKY